MGKITRLTDQTGHATLGLDFTIPRGAVAMVNGTAGTATQKFHSDGMWHGVDGRILTDEELLRQRNVFLIYKP